MSVVSMKALLETGVHFGHRTRRWNPKMKPYIFTERNGIHIVDLQQTIVMIDSTYALVRDIVADLDKEERVALFRSIGESAGRLHGAGIIHGDLTTSNIIESSGQVVFIDFGLAEVSTETEKRGVDLNLMHRMLTSTHFTHIQELFSAFKEGYLTTLGIEGEEALNRMEEVSRRGRYVERG